MVLLCFVARQQEIYAAVVQLRTVAEGRQELLSNISNVAKRTEDTKLLNVKGWLLFSEEGRNVFFKQKKLLQSQSQLENKMAGLNGYWSDVTGQILILWVKTLMPKEQ